VEDELEEAQLDYSTIEANLQIARNNLTTGSIEAKQVYDMAMTNYQYADQLYEIDTNGMEDDLNDAKDTLQEVEDALAAFEEQIGDGTVYAAYSGTILSVSCSAGDELTDEMVIATYADPDNVTMAVSVSQDDISQITVGDDVELTLTAYGDETFAGEVSSIATSATAGSSTVNYEVTVRFTGDVDKVYADMTGEATFVEKEAADVLCISNKAVHQDGARSWVKVLQEDGSAKETTIETGFSNGTKVEVVSGLNEGDIVLIESQVTQ
jgi:HlyD family secretion protein